MLLLLLAYLGGALTIVSPCILPVLPFVFARADQPFLSNGLPMLVGMAATFAVVATLAALGGGWAVEANAIGRVGGDAAARAVRRDAVVSASRRAGDAAAGPARRPAFAIGRREPRRGPFLGRRLAAARRRDRAALGALRGADPRARADRRRAAGRQRDDDAGAARLCARRGDFARPGACWSAAACSRR